MNVPTQGDSRSGALDVSSAPRDVADGKLAEATRELAAAARREIQHAETIERLRAANRELKAALDLARAEQDSPRGPARPDSDEPAAAAMQTRIVSLERELGHAARTHDNTVARYRRQLVVASYCRSEQTRKAHAAALRALSAEYRFYRHQTRLLMAFIEGFRKEVSLLLSSSQWRVGDTIARTAKRLAGKNQPSMAVVYFNKTYSEYSQWKKEFESRGEIRIGRELLDESGGAAGAEDRLRRMESAAGVLRQEIAAAKADVDFLIRHYNSLEYRFTMIRKSLHFRLGLVLVRQLVRFRRDPNSALYLVHLQARSHHFKTWLAAYKSVLAKP